MDPKISEIEREYMRGDLPAFAPGDTVRVRVRVVEGDKERIQAFEGICIARRGGGVSETFTVRRISGGVGVERTFPLHSPTIAGIEVVRRGHVRRAKLYYLRARRGKRARVRERRWWLDAAREAEREAYLGEEPEAEPVVPGEGEVAETAAPEGEADETAAAREEAAGSETGGNEAGAGEPVEGLAEPELEDEDGGADEEPPPRRGAAAEATAE